MYTTVTTEPTSGNFVRVWEYDNQIWCDKYEWQDGTLHVFSSDTGDWVSVGEATVIRDDDIGVTNTKYIIIGEV